MIEIALPTEHTRQELERVGRQAEQLTSRHTLRHSSRGPPGAVEVVPAQSDLAQVHKAQGERHAVIKLPSYGERLRAQSLGVPGIAALARHEPLLGQPQGDRSLIAAGLRDRDHGLQQGTRPGVVALMECQSRRPRQDACPCPADRRAVRAPRRSQRRPS